jgi:hypothetical protein
MTDLSVSDVRLFAGRRPRARRLLRGVGDFLTLLGAAVRVGRAVENRAAPRPADLAILGIEGSLPRRW